jgi:hypothetical protein
VSIRIDPLDINAIRQAIVDLKQNDARRETMSRAAVTWSERFCIDNRAKAVRAFMGSRVPLAEKRSRDDR